MQSDIIILRSVYGKVNQKYVLNPCTNKETGMLPSCVKQVDSNGDMILSEKDKQSGQIFIPVTEQIVVQDGTVFDLSNPLQKARWDAIKDCDLIAPERNARDRNGDFVIDGGSMRYGIAVLYVQRPGQITESRVNKAKLINRAISFVFGDSIDGQKTKCKLLGKSMDNAYPADIEDYLSEYARRNPQKIIDLYTGGDESVRILFFDAVQKGVIREKDGVFLYGDKIAMGVTDEAVITYLKQPANQKIVEYIKQETYPEYYTLAEGNEPMKAEEIKVAEVKPLAPKTTARKPATKTKK